MEEVPSMPAVPAAGQEVSGETVFAAERARADRALLLDNTSVEAKRQRGEDLVRQFNITATAADYRGLHQQEQVLQVLQQQGQTLQQHGQALQQHGQVLQAIQQTLQQQGQTLQQQGQMLQQQGQMLQQMLARLDNVRRRAYNHRVCSLGGELQLQPLCREAAAGGAAAGGAAAGDLPAAGVFPADRQALNNLTAQRLNALQEFYGQLFAGDSVASRREAFVEFVTL